MADVLFLINGLGLGNSTRCDAIIRELVSDGISVAVGTSGNGLWYYEGAVALERVQPLKELKYSQDEGSLSVRKTLGDLGSLVRIVADNAKRVNQLLDEVQPRCVVIDSFYAIYPVKRRGIPIVALNNSDVVVESYLNQFDVPKSVRAQFWAIEYSDYLFHRAIADTVISPCLEPSLPVRSRKFFRVPPTIRKDFQKVPSKGSVNHVVIMLSGSVFSTPFRLTKPKYDFKVSVVGRSHDGTSHVPQGVTYCGRVRDVHRIVEDSDLIVVNGGFSAVSEAFCMEKPMVVVPIPNHAEQWVNAETIRQLGVGEIGSAETLEKEMLNAVSSIERYRAAYMEIETPLNGARQAANIISDLI